MSVGGSSGNSKEVTVPLGTKCAKVVNKSNWDKNSAAPHQNANDQFSTELKTEDKFEHRLLVKRTDASGGWGMNLKFSCGCDPDGGECKCASEIPAGDDENEGRVWCSHDAGGSGLLEGKRKHRGERGVRGDGRSSSVLSERAVVDQEELSDTSNFTESFELEDDDDDDSAQQRSPSLLDLDLDSGAPAFPPKEDLLSPLTLTDRAAAADPPAGFKRTAGPGIYVPVLNLDLKTRGGNSDGADYFQFGWTAEANKNLTDSKKKASTLSTKPCRS